MISESSKEYLKVMYLLSQKGEIRVTDIAEKMGCSKPSVTKQLNILSNEGMVNYETYGKIELTDSGIDIAKKSLEAYDIVYVMLHDLLNLNEDIAREDAEKIKSVVHDETLNTLAKYTHKELGLSDLNCNYDVNNDRCRSCIRRKN